MKVRISSRITDLWARHSRTGRTSLLQIGSAIALCTACTHTAVPISATTVQTEQGTVQGVQADGAYLFKGIPFAAPPTGDNRWRVPQPVAAWTGVRDASQFGPDCIQPITDPAAPSHPQSEDCLTLNVAVPEASAEAALPVLFYVHGGAYFVGSGRTVMKNGPPELVRQGAIIVAPNYRLGRMGFFAHPALTEEAEASGEATANYWLMDEVQALEWVRENISAFGGDPDNITLLGCSAGGSSVNALVASPEARGLFHKAVVRSGGGFFNATRSLDIAEAQGMDFAERAGVSSEPQDTLSSLRALSPEKVLAADPGPPNFGAMVDGTYLQDLISVTLVDGKAAPIPLITGSTSNEASVFGLMGFDKQTLLDRFNVDVDALKPAYETNGPLTEAELLRQVQTDFIFTSAGVGMAALASANGTPAWSYYFDYLPEDLRTSHPGADHCADMPYLFATSEFEAAEDQAIADLLQRQLLNFMRTGNPNGSGLPDWAQMTAGNHATLVVGLDTHSVAGFRKTQLEPWFEKWETEKNRPFPSTKD